MKFSVNKDVQKELKSLDEFTLKPFNRQLENVNEGKKRVTGKRDKFYYVYLLGHE